MARKIRTIYLSMSKDLPLSVKERLLELASKLPEEKRKQFITSTSSRMKELSLDYQNTLIYAAVGWVIGEIIEQVLTIPSAIPLAGGHELLDGASETSGLIGGLLGFLKDRKANAKEQEDARRITRIIQEELAKAINA